MSGHPERALGVSCPTCGARFAVQVDGLCASCLMRLAAPLEGAAGASPNAPPTTDALVAGRRIGNYELIETLARGGMGIVYRARQLTAGRTVALKCMLTHLLHMPGMLQRFRQEVEAVAQLDHPGILPIYEVGEHDSLPFFSMKLAEGGPLDKRITTFNGRWREIAGVVVKIARAIEHAHARGVLHRDLKPANILFDALGEPMVADFGLAKFRAFERGLTLPTFALGSPHYMAPEQISAQFGEVGPATDVYSLGAVLYEMLTGRPPIMAEDAAKALRLVATMTPQSGVHSTPRVPADLDAIALKCLAKNPKDRYASAADLAQDLERWLAGDGASASHEVRVRRAKHVLKRTGVALLVVAAIGGGMLLWREQATKGGAPVVAVASAAPRSLVVTPFRSLDADPQNAAVASTIADDLLYELRQVASFNVVPFRVDVDTANGLHPDQLSSQLGVQVALGGDFQRTDAGFKVTARLWDAQTGKQLSQYEFTVPKGEPREVRTQIATTLVTRLQVESGSDLDTHVGSNGITKSAEAFEKYLRARYLIRWRRPETLAEAARLLRGAIALDPAFARAHSSLAYCYALWVGPAPAEGAHWALAEQFAHEAIALNSRLGEPYAVLGDAASIRGDFGAAEQWLTRAMQRDARDPATLHFYAVHLYSVGKLRAAREMERKGVALDSSSPQPMMWLAMLTTLIGEESEARRLWARADELGAARPLMAAVVRLSLGQNEFLREWHPQHWPETRVPEPLRDSSALVTGILDESKRQAALDWMHQVEKDADRAFLITHYALLGDADGAFRAARDYDLEDDDWYLYQLANIWAPQTALLRRDPRFAELMQRWGLSDYWRRFGAGDFCELTETAVRCH